jgi:putative alpha-1,2-mannosidase
MTGASSTPFLVSAYQKGIRDFDVELAYEGLKKNHSYFLERSSNYKNLLDPVSGYVRPKNEKGQWMQDYSPATYAEGFVEPNGYQATWFVPHDYEGLASLMGGKEKAIKKLNWQFEEAARLGFTSGKKHADETVNNSDSNVYIQKLSLNGEKLDRLYLRHSEIVAGGHLKLEMGPEPGKSLGIR